jgi:pimeloyl-ACP methyl ester carboxylesterase
MRVSFWLLLSALGCATLEQQPPVPPRAARASTAEPVQPAVMEGHLERATRLVLSIKAERFREAHALLGPEMKAKLSEAELERAWQTTRDDFGNFLAITETERKKAGKLDRVRFTCEFSRKTLVIEVLFDPSDAITGLWFRQHYPPWSEPSYADPNRFEERRLHIGVEPTLPALLTIPSGGVSLPAVVLVHGSGPQDADERVSDEKYANRPFKDLAWGLATRGLAVLRYEKRTRVAPQSLPAALTLDDEVTLDACAALDALRAAAEVDAKRLVVIGHSLGGRLAARIATRCPPVAGVVLLAAPTARIDHSLERQYKHLMTASGASAEAIDAEIRGLRAGFAKVLENGALDEPISIGGSKAPRSYWRDLVAVDTLAELARFRGGVLALQGARDYQVDPTLEFSPIERALKNRKGSHAKLYPSLNHHFIPGEGVPSAAEYEVPGHVSREVVRDIDTFVRVLPKSR